MSEHRELDADEKAVVDYMIVRACRHDVSSNHLMRATVGRVALSVGTPLKGMSREMVFIKSGLSLGLISATNDPVRSLEKQKPKKAQEIEIVVDKP